MIEYTSKFWFTYKKATELANAWTKGEDTTGGSYISEESGWRREYNTAIRGAPYNSKAPEYCWAITNKFDPRVARGE